MRSTIEFNSIIWFLYFMVDILAYVLIYTWRLYILFYLFCCHTQCNFCATVDRSLVVITSKWLECVNDEHRSY